MKYWRIRFGTSTGGTSEDIWLAEVTLKNAVGTDISVGGAASASSVYDSSLLATYAFDKNLTKYWASAAGQFPCWIRYELASAERVESIVLVAPSISSSSDELPVPGSIFVEHSENGVDWVTATSLTQSGSFSPGATVTLSGFVFPGIIISAYAAAATPLGAPAALALHPLAARIAAPTPLGAAQALIEFNGAAKARAAAPSLLGAAQALAQSALASRAAAPGLLGAPAALASVQPMAYASAPAALGSAQVLAIMTTAYALAASSSPLGDPSVVAYCDDVLITSLGQSTQFGVPSLVSVHRVQDGVQLLDFIPPLIAGYTATFGTVVAQQEQSIAAPVFGTPSVSFSTTHPATSIEATAAFGVPVAQSIHAAQSLEPVVFGAIGDPDYSAQASSLSGQTAFGQPVATTVHPVPDWYAGIRIGPLASSSFGSFPVLDGIQLTEFGEPRLGATAHRSMPLHLMPTFGPITISRGTVQC